MRAHRAEHELVRLQKLIMALQGALHLEAAASLYVVKDAAHSVNVLASGSCYLQPMIQSAAWHHAIGMWQNLS